MDADNAVGRIQTLGGDRHAAVSSFFQSRPSGKSFFDGFEKHHTSRSFPGNSGTSADVNRMFVSLQNHLNAAENVRMSSGKNLATRRDFGKVFAFAYRRLSAQL